MILIGSRALILRAPNLLDRDPKDFDFISTKEEFDLWLKENSDKINPTKIYSEMDGKKWIIEGSSNCEFEIIQPNGSSALFQSLVEQDSETINTSFGLIPNLDLLFTLKASHRYLKNSPHFWKTAKDYHNMKQIGCTIRPEYKEFFKLREQEAYQYQHPKLNTNKKDFFLETDNFYKYDHDHIHRSVAIGDKPAYTYYMKDGEEVQCDKKKFFDLPLQVRMNGVIEEAAVLAIERSLIPHPGVWSPEYAWHFALAKVCSSITSGWFREFSFDNLPEIIKQYPKGYWEKFQEDLKNGLIKLFSGTKY